MLVSQPRRIHRARVLQTLTTTASLALVSTLVVAAPNAAASPAAISDDTVGVNGVVYATVQMGDRIYVGGDFSFAGRWTGSGAVVDSTGGRLAVPGLRISGPVQAAVRDGKGGWYIGGAFTQVLGQSRLGLARIASTGKITTFRADVTGNVNALALVGSTLYVGGSFSHIGGASRSNLAAIDTTTGAVTAWDPKPNGAVHAIASPASSTSVLVGGTFTSIGGASRAGVAELPHGASTVTSWNPGVAGTVHAIQPSADGAVAYLGGSFSAAGGASRANLVAVDLSTGSATAWSADTDGPVLALATRSGDGRLLVGGDFSRVGGEPRSNLAAVSATGSTEPWNPGANGAVRDLESVTGGTVLMVGDFTTLAGQPRQHSAAVDSLGTLQSWNPSTDQPVAAVAQSGTRRLIAGAFEYANGAPRANVAAIDVATGDLATEFRADTDAVVKSLAGAVDGSTVYVGGAFSKLSGQPRSRLGAVDALTGQATTWNPSANGNVNALLATSTHVYAGGAFQAIGPVYARRLARIEVPTGKADKNFKPTPDAQVRALALTPNGQTLFAVGHFKLVSGQGRNGAAAVDPVTGALAPWTPSAGGAAIATDLSPDGSRIYFSTSSNRMYVYDWTVSNTPAWILRAGGDVQAIAVTSSEVYIGGHFRNLPEQKISRNHLASVSPIDGTATAWKPGANGSFGVWAITAVADALLIGGDFNKAGNRRQPGFARFSGAP